MIVNTFEYSVAAAAAPTNLAPSAFNPIPDDGVLDVWAVLDSGIAAITKPPTISVILGGSVNLTPVLTSSITGDPYSQPGATDFGDPSGNPVISGLPVRRGTNIQVLVGGAAGATATGRIRMLYRTAAEVAGGVAV